MAEYQNILVGIDGSKQSLLAFKKAVAIAQRNGARLHLLSVVNGEPYPSAITTFGISDKGLYDKVVDKMKHLLADLTTQAQAAGVQDVKTSVVVGNAKVILTDTYPKNEDIDLILVGATGLNTIGRMIVGSTSAYIVRQAPCDVVVVKTDEDNQPVTFKQATYPEI